MLAALLALALSQEVVLPPPATSDPFIVSFNSGSASLGAEQEKTIQFVAAAMNSGEYTYTRVEIVGRADRQGPSSYNLKLSQRRAEAIRAALVARGVPNRLIKTEAVGEANPIIPTADGVAEGRNRLASIMMY